MVRKEACFVLVLMLILITYGGDFVMLQINRRRVEEDPQPLPQPAVRSGAPREVFHLHIPKTGTSFWRELIEYMCPTNTSEQILEIFGLILKNQHAETYPCASSIRRGHSPLHTPLNATATIIRNPRDRIASGFLHNLHDCRYLQKKLHIDEHDSPETSMHQICENLETYYLNTTSSNRQHNNYTQVVRDLVLSYMQCVSGCSINMLMGERCQRRPPQPYTSEVAERPESLAFIGLTERFDESMCLWRSVFFPRVASNAPYLSSTSSKLFRTTPLPRCKQKLKILMESDNILQRTLERDPDWALYNRSVELFEERLPAYCKQSRKHLL